jgi:choline dehydrogenase-like flavoprotein
VSEGTFRSERFSLELLNSLAEAGWPETDDLNSMDAVNRSMRAMRYIDQKGSRQDTATKYLHPRLNEKHPHLHVVIQSRVKKVLFDDNKRATAVIYKPSWGPDRAIKVRKTTVLSAGALGSPQILERSGVGSPDIVKRGDAGVIVALPGVGENYDDHHMMIYAYKSNLNPEETLDGVTSGRLKPEEMVAQKNKLLGWNAVDVQAKVRPSDDEVSSLGPDFQTAWDKSFKSKPDKPLMIFSSTVWFVLLYYHYC